MTDEVIFIVEEAPEGGYLARALGHSIFTEADNVQKLRVEIVDAVQCHFDGPERPQIVRLHFVKDEVLSL